MLDNFFFLMAPNGGQTLHQKYALTNGVQC